MREKFIMFKTAFQKRIAGLIYSRPADFKWNACTKHVSESHYKEAEFLLVFL